MHLRGDVHQVGWVVAKVVLAASELWGMGYALVCVFTHCQKQGLAAQPASWSATRLLGLYGMRPARHVHG
jgi:hypothetical protein